MTIAFSSWSGTRSYWQHVRVWDMKIEEGSEATPWTPNPGDDNSQLANEVKNLKAPKREIYYDADIINPEVKFEYTDLTPLQAPSMWTDSSDLNLSSYSTPFVGCRMNEYDIVRFFR